MYLAQKGHRNTSTEEFAEMVGGKFAKSGNDMLLDGAGGFFRVIGIDRDGLRREVGVVDRIVNRYGDLISRTTVDRRASNASPHRLKMMKRSAHGAERSYWYAHLKAGDGGGPDSSVQAGQSTPGSRRGYRLEGLVGHDVKEQDGWRAREMRCPKFIPWELPWPPQVVR